MGPSMGGAGILMLILLTGALRCFAYKPGGFISIDCGSSKKEYVDPHTNLTWEEDGVYMLSGENAAIPNIAATDASTSENSKALMDFRYFPVRRQKYCYELPLRSDSTTFLLRAMFLHGGSPHLGLYPRFEVYVYATLWLTINYLDQDSRDKNGTLLTVIVEGIFFNPGTDVVNVCLVPDVGIPFISSLELRELDHEGVIYSDYLSDGRWGQSLFLTNLQRLKMGLQTTSLRYPDDQFDRIWEDYCSFADYDCDSDSDPDSDPDSDSGQVRPLHVNASNVNINLTTFNNLPRRTLEFGLGLDKDGPFSADFTFVSYNLMCFIVYLHSNHSSQASAVPINITVQGRTESRESKSTFSVISLFSTEMSGNFHLEVHSPSNLPLDLVALEAYRQSPFNTSGTDPGEARFVNILKSNWNLSDWQGDPCLPVPNDWLTCSTLGGDEFLYTYIQSINLSYIPNFESILEYKGVVDQEQPSELFDLSLTHSEIDDDTWFSLPGNIFKIGSLNNLNLSYNKIHDFWNSSNWNFSEESLPLSVDTLDVSHNRISRAPLPSELEFLFPSFSFPSTSSPWTSIPSTSFGHSLSALDISNNAMRGEFPFGGIYNHSSLELMYMNADNNFLSGSLNLTSWYEELQGVSPSKVEDDSSDDSVFYRLFTFINNNITSIVPDVDDIEHSLNASLLIQKFNTNKGGILLHGNPYCTEAKGLFHRYLCRNSTSDTSYEIHHSKKSKLPYFIGIPGGVLLLMVGFIGTITILRLRKKVEILQNFQQELLNRNVQPPFFSYQDLKIATRDFHNDNKLGNGAFGEVYKGVLPDKTIVAVKKLFVKQELHKQVLNDFLNEVVLLTGIKHRNLVQLLGCCLNNKERILVYEFVNQGDLANALWGHQAQIKVCLDWQQRLNICLGVARGLSYLHEELQPRIIHRDIKALNVLVDKNLNPKIADFGLAKPFQDEETQVEFTAFVGTKGYLAPEYILDGLLTEKADVYSFGILILEIVSGRKCVDLSQSQDKGERVYLKYWAEDLMKRGNILELLDPELRGQCPDKEVRRVIDIAFLCLDKEHKQRPSMSQVVIMLAAEMTSETLKLYLHETKAAAALQSKGKNLMTPLEMECDGGSYSYEVDAGMPSRGWGWIDLDDDQTHSGRSEEDALVPSGQLDLSDSKVLTSGEELSPGNNSIRSQSTAVLQRMRSKLSMQKPKQYVDINDR